MIDFVEFFKHLFSCVVDTTKDKYPPNFDHIYVVS
jgi:hypothetical protein